jgi:hypothetical protein
MTTRVDNIFNSVEMEHLGSGVCIFRNAISFDWQWAFETMSKLVDEDMADMYSPIIHPETGKPALVNKSGYIFSDSTFMSMPGRCSTSHQRTDERLKEFLCFLEDSKDRYLLQYLTKFPLAYKNIWWKVKGHIVKYSEENKQYLGKHSDTSADYVYGFPHPSDQLATRNTVSCIVYINDCSDGMDAVPENSFSGGHHYFDFLEIDYTPRKGDIMMFPSNFIASHEVKQVTRGERYSYLGWYSHGSPNPDFNEAIIDPISDPDTAKVGTNIYMPKLREDFRSHLESIGVDKNSHAYSLVRDGF